MIQLTHPREFCWKMVQVGDLLLYHRFSFILLSSDVSPVASEWTVSTPGDKGYAFKLPPSFFERASVASLEYKLVVTVHRRGCLRDDKR
jgi:hypothetical protein